MLLIILHKKSVPYLTEKLQIFLLVVVINKNYDLYEQYSSVIWSCDYNMSLWGHGLKKPISRAMKIEESERQAVIAETEEEKFVSILCTKTHANPGYLSASQMGLAVCKQKGGKVLATTMHSKPQKRVKIEH